MSMSLSGPAVPRAAEPNSAAWRTPRAQRLFVLPKRGDDVLTVHGRIIYHESPSKDRLHAAGQCAPALIASGGLRASYFLPQTRRIWRKARFSTLGARVGAESALPCSTAISEASAALVFLGFGSAGLTTNNLRVRCLLGLGTPLTRRKRSGTRFQRARVPQISSRPCAPRRVSCVHHFFMQA
jgi:hypothetical protein